MMEVAFIANINSWGILSRNGRRLLLVFIIQLTEVCAFSPLVTEELSSWPFGTYGIPMPKSGCPAKHGWETGIRLHKTEANSFASEGNHFSGISSAKTDHVIQHFCIKTSYESDRTNEFMPGRYCILKKGECPNRFREGWIYWDDAASWLGPSVQNHSGTLPDGEYARNTKIFYCCRNDGVPHREIKLPATQPFFLLKLGEECQQVEEMTAADEFIQFAGEKSFNLDTQDGLTPKLDRMRQKAAYMKLYYCYYTPKTFAPMQPSNVLQTFLFIIYVICAIIGLALTVAIALATIQRLLFYRHERRRQRRLAATAVDAEQDNYCSVMVPSSSSSGGRGVGIGIAAAAYNEDAAANVNNKLIEYALRPPSYEAAAAAGATGGACGGMQQGIGGASRMLQDACPMMTPDEAPPSYDEALIQATDANIDN